MSSRSEPSSLERTFTFYWRAVSGRLLLSEHSVTTLDAIHHMDVLAWLRGAPSNWLNCVITSPPYYGLRDYGEDGQLGLEDTPAEYVARMVAIFREARRVLRDDGTCWIVIGDSYWGGKGQSGHADPEMQMVRVASGVSFNAPAAHVGGHGQTRPTDRKHETLKPKDLIGIPWRVAFALQADGWYLRSEITWCKTAPMPESVTDRPTTATEKVFMFTKSPRYWYDAEAVRVKSSDNSHGGGVSHGGRYMALSGRNDGNSTMGIVTATRNLWNYWLISPEPSPLHHFAMYPQALIEPMVLAGCPAQVCAVCGAPYDRVVEREPMEVRHSGRAAQMGEYGRTCTSGTMTKPPMTHTLGWRATCSCAAATRPGIVYDPFMGSGTTALVAQRLGRHFVGTDLNREYVELARKRVQYRGDDRRMMREQEAGVEQIALFEDGAA